METKLQIGNRVDLNCSYDQAIEKATQALKAEGFGVLTEIDVKATLKKKLDVDFRRYVILGACTPPLAHKALSADLDVGLLLPCNIVIYEVDEQHSVVGLVDPIAMLGVLDAPELAPVADEARARLARVAEALKE